MSKNAWISVSIFAALFVLVIATREERVTVGVRNLALPSIDKDKVTRIELSGAMTAVLTRAADVWNVAEPGAPDKKFAVEQSAIDAALAALPDLEADTFVTARTAKHEELELTDEKGLRAKIDHEGGPSVDLIFGRSAKGGGNYLRKAGTDEVFVGKGRFAALAKKDVKGWRKRKLVDAKPEDLKSITVLSPGGGSYIVESFKEGAGEDEKSGLRFASSVTLPEGFIADEDAFKRLFNTFTNLRATELIDDKKPEEVGLGAGQGTKVTAIRNDDGVISARFGVEDDKKRVYTQMDGDEQLYLVSQYTVTNVTKDKLELRDLSIARFDAADVERAVFKGTEGTVEVARKDGAWTLTQPATPPAGFEFDAATVEGKLSAIARVKGTKRFDAEPSGAKLAAPDVTITLFLKDGGQKRIAFGAPVPKEDDKAQEEFYLRGAEEEAVYTIGKWQRSRYEKPLDLFKKVAAPPQPPGGGGISGMENLPPDIRKKLEESLKQQGLPGR